MHPDHGRVATGIHRRLRREAFLGRERHRRFPATSERTESRLDNSAVLPDSGRPPFPVDRYPRFGRGAQVDFADLDGCGPTATGRPVDRLQDELRARIAFPENSHVVVAVDGYLGCLCVVCSRHDFAFELGLGEVFRRAPAFSGRSVGAFDHCVDPVPAIPNRGRVPFGIKHNVRAARVFARFGNVHRRQPFGSGQWRKNRAHRQDQPQAHGHGLSSTPHRELTVWEGTSRSAPAP
jgi:hypothetical protein